MKSPKLSPAQHAVLQMLVRHSDSILSARTYSTAADSKYGVVHYVNRTAAKKLVDLGLARFHSTYCVEITAEGRAVVEGAS